jgi:long-chain acyl-CoA synthetase
MERFSPYSALQEHASKQPDTEAIIFEDLVVSYGEFMERVTAFADWMLANGFAPGEVTGLCIRGEIEHLTCAMALLCLGSPQISLGSHEVDATKRVLARKVGVTWLVVDKPEIWMEGIKTLVAPIGDPKMVAGPPGNKVGSVFVDRTLDSIGVYQNTSGSTGIPRTFGFTLERLHSLSKHYASDPKERRALRTGSIEFDAHRLSRLCSLLAGNSSIFLRHFDLRDLITLCERAAVSAVHTSVYKLALLIKSQAHFPRRLPPFTAVQTGGTRVPGRLRKELKRLLTDNLWVLYATSEIGKISIASPDQHESFPEGVGFPAADVVSEIVDRGGQSVRCGEIGEIRIRKAGMASGYIAEAGRSPNFEDGWFYPRDLVSRNDGEPFIFHGRTDDVMILNGINIFPSAIENTLEINPDVQEAIAYSIKSRIHGDIPVAAVVLKESAQGRDVSHLLGHCRQVLGIRAPRQIFVVDRIPRNAAGKPLKRELGAN